MRDELKRLQEKKEEIDVMAHRQVRRILWSGLGMAVIQVGFFFRLTFWEFSWDVMEPIAFFTTTTGIVIGYAYFLFTSRDPTYQDFMQRLFNSRQRKLCKKLNFDVERFKELQQKCKTPLGASASIKNRVGVELELEDPLQRDWFSVGWTYFIGVFFTFNKTGLSCFIGSRDPKFYLTSCFASFFQFLTLAFMQLLHLQESSFSIESGVYLTLSILQILNQPFQYLPGDWSFVNDVNFYHLVCAQCLFFFFFFNLWNLQTQIEILICREQWFWQSFLHLLWTMDSDLSTWNYIWGNFGSNILSICYLTTLVCYSILNPVYKPSCLYHKKLRRPATLAQDSYSQLLRCESQKFHWAKKLLYLNISLSSK